MEFLFKKILLQSEETMESYRYAFIPKTKLFFQSYELESESVGSRPVFTYNTWGNETKLYTVKNVTHYLDF